MKKNATSLGRPREYDIELAVEKAMAVFWSKGYEGTSLLDLTTAMKISRPSLYAAFGNKEQLFLRVLDKYRAEPASYLARSLEEPTARAAFESLLEGAIRLQAGGTLPLGCLYVQGALATNEAFDAIRQELVSRRFAGEEAIRTRFEKAKSDGDLPTDSSPTDLAKFTVTVLHGLAVQAASGDNIDELRQVARIALNAFPGK
ncbi:MAG TPA: TetR/AcrR family transcriptional regulator [Pyrinomonadaceae bacterium]|nr:TetR/AcrR family transcriptional regulator [Pyrinomonadaceae bacterium]